MQDADGGVVGRRADQVGSFYLIYKDDFAAMAEDYYEYTRRVRFDPDAWSTSGDVYTAEQGSGRPWISEMYGYAFAAAVHG